MIFLIGEKARVFFLKVYWSWCYNFLVMQV